MTHRPGIECSTVRADDACSEESGFPRRDLPLEFKVLSRASDRWIIAVVAGGNPPSPLIGLYRCEASALTALPAISTRWLESLEPDVVMLRDRYSRNGARFLSAVRSFDRLNG